MKFANVKAMVAKSMILAVAAGALMLASPTKADAQHFVVGVGIGSSHYAIRDQGYDQYSRRDRDDRYDAPRYDRYERYEFERREEMQRREAFFRQQQWLRMHQYDGRYDYR